MSETGSFKISLAQTMRELRHLKDASATDRRQVDPGFEPFCSGFGQYY